MQQELWVAAPGFNGKYEVSSFGRVKSMFCVSKLGKRRFTQTILKPSVNSRGYYIVKLSGKTHKIHRLIALAFHENPENKPQVNHKDLNQLNNKSDNLEWATAKENTNHAQDNGRRPKGEKGYIRTGVRYGWRKKIRNKVTGQKYDSVYELVSILGKSVKAISRRLSGERANDTDFEYIPGERTRIRYCAGSSS